jgi:hypothetical protein
VSRNLLHISKLEAFKWWLTRTGRGWRSGKGAYQVIQVMTDNSGWQVVFRRDSMPEHYSINAALEPIVRRFIHDSRIEEEAHARAVQFHEEEIQHLADLDRARDIPWPDTQKLDLPVLEDALESVDLSVSRPPWEGEESFEKERCTFCGASVVCPCDSPPADTCSKALEAAYAQRPDGMR